MQRFKKRFSNQVPSNVSRDKKYRVLNPKPQGEKIRSSQGDKSNCAECGKSHEIKWLVEKDIFFDVERVSTWWMIFQWQIFKRWNNQAKESGPNSGSPKRNLFYVLISQGYQDNSPNVITCMLQVFSIKIFALLDLDATFSYVTPLVSMKFNILHDVL